MFMAGTSNGACGHVQPGPGVPVSGSCTPRKFSEKIALLTQRQAEDTAAFQEVMMDMTSTRVSRDKVKRTGLLASPPSVYPDWQHRELRFFFFFL